MLAFKRTDCSYCAYGWPFQKNTAIWHNFPSLRLKQCHDHCFWRVVGRSSGHPLGCQHAPREMRPCIPYCLCFDILTQACRALGCSPVARLPLAPAPKKAAEPNPAPRRTRGRPEKQDAGLLACAVCGTETAKFYGRSGKTEIMCNRCYRARRRAARRTAPPVEPEC